MTIALMLLAAKGDSSAIGAIGALIILVLAIVLIAREATARYHVVTRGGVPYCPRCNRQVSYRREQCRSCGYRIKTYGEGTTTRQSHRAPGTENLNVADILRSHTTSRSPGPTPTIPVPVSYFESLHRNPTDIVIKWRILDTILDTLQERLMGPKKLEKELARVS